MKQEIQLRTQPGIRGRIYRRLNGTAAGGGRAGTGLGYILLVDDGSSAVSFLKFQCWLYCLVQADSQDCR
ncbi:MAG: hypothetical protein Ct9H300mP28_15870 [Pseudomonadota bacterium]|nr:MAG: hypothetical protein Ct9H300mP28_15870 [Pseudomonadota bacterium]